MALHKIRNIDENVCTAEQKLAYNHAFSLCDLKVTIDKAVELLQSSLQADFYNKYSRDAIITAFRNGFDNYRNSTYQIFTSYEDIGNMFYL